MEIFIELGLILLITTLTSILIGFLKQPLVVGYILSGIIAGPYLFNILHSTEQIELFSKIGISILLFIVGISLSPTTIKETGKTSLVTGIGQILVTSLLGYYIVRFLGFDVVTSIYASVALTFSSTIIVLKLLSDRGDLGKLYGKLSIGFLLVQDLVATLLLIIVPLLGGIAHGTQSVAYVFFDLLFKGIGAFIILFVISKYLLPKIYDNIAHSQELLFLFSLTWGLVLASIFYKLGFSIEIGALVAGVTLSASNYAFEISSRMRPLRDFFITMFFVLLGSQLVLSDINSIILPALILSVFILVGNPIIVFVLMNLLGYRRRVSFMCGLTVAQISEFSLILMSLGLAMGHLDQTIVSLVTLVGIVTIAGSTYMIIYADKIFSIVKSKLKYLEIRKHHKFHEENQNSGYDMIIFGYGRVGFGFVRTAQKTNKNYLVVDYNPDTISHMRGDGVNFRFGDAEDVEFLDEILISKANIVISTIPDTDINLSLVRHYRKQNSTGSIIVSSHSVVETQNLYNEGATYVIMSHYLGAHYASEMIFESENNPSVFAKARNIQLSQISENHHI